MSSIGLYLMGQKGLYCLTAIVNSSTEGIKEKIAFVMAAKDPAVLNDYFEEIQQLAAIYAIPFYERGNSTKTNFNVDLKIAIGWRWLIRDYSDKLIVFHDSLLPKYRGFNPLVTALIEGDSQIGVTALQASEEFDRGNIVGVKSITVNYPLKIQTAIEKVSELYGQLIIEIIEQSLNGALLGKPQDESMATYSLWRDEEDYRINWNEKAQKVKRFIDAVGYPYKGAFCFYDGKKIRIRDASVAQEYNVVNRTPGKILFIKENKPYVVCGQDVLVINEAVLDENEELISFHKLRVRL